MDPQPRTLAAARRYKTQQRAVDPASNRVGRRLASRLSTSVSLRAKSPLRMGQNLIRVEHRVSCIGVNGHGLKPGFQIQRLPWPDRVHRSTCCEGRWVVEGSAATGRLRRGRPRLRRRRGTPEGLFAPQALRPLAVSPAQPSPRNRAWPADATVAACARSCADAGVRRRRRNAASSAARVGRRRLG